MNEVTPDLIAKIATRLYNEIPGAGSLPKTEAESREAAPEAAVAPAGLAAIRRRRGHALPVAARPSERQSARPRPPSSPERHAGCAFVAEIRTAHFEF